MKLKIKRVVLLEALNNVAKAISTKNIIPILSGIKFELHRDRLVVTASDNDITIQTVIEKGDNLIIENTGSIVIKGKYILDIIRKLDSEFINIEIIDDHKIVVFTENSEFNLNGIEAREYPDINLDLSPDFVSMEIDDFRSMILQTNYACSLDEARVVLTGVNIKIDGENLEFSATDSYRLALRKKLLTNSVNNGADIIIPSKNLSELLKLLSSGADELIEMHLFSNKVIFKFNTDNNIITLEIKNNLLKITSMSLEIGKVEEKLEVSCDNDIKISFSAKYMMDALRTIKSRNVILTFVGEIKPILLKNDDSDDLVCLILPIRTY